MSNINILLKEFVDKSVNAKLYKVATQDHYNPDMSIISGADYAYTQLSQEFNYTQLEMKDLRLAVTELQKQIKAFKEEVDALKVELADKKWVAINN